MWLNTNQRPGCGNLLKPLIYKRQNGLMLSPSFPQPFSCLEFRRKKFQGWPWGKESESWIHKFCKMFEFIYVKNPGQPFPIHKLFSIWGKKNPSNLYYLEYFHAYTQKHFWLMCSAFCLCKMLFPPSVMSLRSLV